MSYSSIEAAKANEKHFYILGGGGEPQGDSTIFDSNLEYISKFVKESNWKTFVSFNGGHKKTESILSNNKNWADKGQFTFNTYNSILKDIKNKLLNGELKNGDQLMILVQSHGAKNLNEISHSIALAGKEAVDKNTLSGSDKISLDTLIPIIQLAKEKGVKLALIDQSCHSGNSLKMTNSNTCIISASGENHFSYLRSNNTFPGFSSNEFIDTFNENLLTGRNLEQIFLLARKAGTSPDFPMITTPEGGEIQSMLYELITPYLYYNINEESKKLDDLYSVEKIAEISCTLAKKFNDLMGIISNVEKIKPLALSLDDFKDLRSDLTEYRTYQVDYESSYKKLNNISNQIRENISGKYPEENEYLNQTDVFTIMNGNYDSSIAYFQSIYSQSTDKTMRTKWLAVIEDLKKKKSLAQAIRENLEKISARDKKHISEHKKMLEASYHEDKIYKLTNKISEKIKIIYDELYQRNKRPMTNPCRDFAL